MKKWVIYILTFSFAILQMHDIIPHAHHDLYCPSCSHESTEITHHDNHECCSDLKSNENNHCEECHHFLADHIKAIDTKVFKIKKLQEKSNEIDIINDYYHLKKEESFYTNLLDISNKDIPIPKEKYTRSILLRGPPTA